MRYLLLLIFINLIALPSISQRGRSNVAIPSPGDVIDRNRNNIVNKDDLQNINNTLNFNPNKYSLDYSTNYLLNHVQIYPIVNFNPKTTISGKNNRSDIHSIRIIDGRFDVQKVGFLPCDHTFQERSLYMIGLQMQGNVAGWLKDNFIDKAIIIDSNSSAKRQLIILIKQFWYGFSAKESPDAKIKLINTLHYRFDIFSSLETGYYPLKKIEGSFNTNYLDPKAYNALTDSLLQTLKTQLNRIDFNAHENEKDWLSPADFIDYCNKDLKKIQHIKTNKKGLYETYTDFIANKPFADSVVFIKKYTNSGNTIPYACHLAPYQKGEAISGTKAWGYFDGASIYVNIGNGFYIKLLQSGDDYVFLFLKNMGYDRIKSEMEHHIYINETPYNLIRNFTKQYSLIYKLDYYTGNLF